MTIIDSEIHSSTEPVFGPEQPVQSDAPRRGGRVATVGLVLAGALLGAGTVHALSSSHPGAVTDTASVGAAGTSPLSALGTELVPRGALGGTTGTTGAAGPADAAGIAAKIDPAVVDINTELGYLNGQAAGTGVVLTPDGRILTNNHVISGATSISVTDIGNGRTYTADVVGYDKSADVAVLQLRNASGLATATIAGTPAKAGDEVVGVGNAGGVGGRPSYAGGVITATGQSITAGDEVDGSAEQLTNLLQTNAAIVSGDSGGPLVNTDGEVVGLDTAATVGFRFSRTSEGFAIPIADALGIAADIVAGRASEEIHLGRTAMLGVSVTPDTATSAGSTGALVEQVLAGGPAATAGLAAGDTITAIGSTAVRSATDLSRAVLERQPGTTVTVHYLDANGRARTSSIKLAEGPAQ